MVTHSKKDWCYSYFWFFIRRSLSTLESDYSNFVPCRSLFWGRGWGTLSTKYFFIFKTQTQNLKLKMKQFHLRYHIGSTMLLQYLLLEKKRGSFGNISINTHNIDTFWTLSANRCVKVFNFLIMGGQNIFIQLFFFLVSLKFWTLCFFPFKICGAKVCKYLCSWDHYIIYFNFFSISLFSLGIVLDGYNWKLN